LPVENTHKSGTARSVLVIDDDPATLRLLNQYLRSAGYKVLTAGSGEEALHIFNQECPKIVVTDLSMPNISGLDLCRLIRASESFGFVYILALSSHSDKHSILEAFNAGVNDFLAKPFDEHELLARLHAGTRILNLEEKLAQDQLAIHKANAELIVLNDKLNTMATTDELTGLSNRREAMKRLREFWNTAKRQNRTLTCLMLDIDNFKHYNDTYGHEAGDYVLRHVAGVFRKTVRAGESFFRMGGEEFLILCPGAFLKEATACGERIRVALEENVVHYQKMSFPVTASIGVAEVDPHTSSCDELLCAADMGLYQAKRAGKNRVCIAGDRVEHTSNKATLEPVPDTSLPSSADRLVKVLVVDNDKTVRFLCKNILEQRGCEVFEAGNAVEGLAASKNRQPDVILMDVGRSNWNGLECTRRLKADPVTHHIPVVIMRSHLSEEDIQEDLQAGADEYLHKPLDPKDLIYRVRSMAKLHWSKIDLIQSNEVRGDQARALSILLDLSRAITTSTNLNFSLDKIIAATAELTGCRRISIMLPDAEGRDLVVARSIGIGKKTAQSIRLSIGGEIAGRVYLSGEPVFINKPEEAKRLHEHYNTDFFLSAPLISTALRTTDRVVGVMNITERYDGRSFEPMEVEYIDLICNITASAIDVNESRIARDNAYNAIVVALARLAEHRDCDTGKHLDRVTSFALMLAKELRTTEQFRNQINDEYLYNLERAVPLHDIGKVAIPDHILLKPGKLTDQEMAIMRTHVDVGVQTIGSVIQQNPQAPFLHMAMDVIAGHHEWYNGLGYPKGIKGEETPLAARIAAVADVYDALTTKRSYKEAFSHEKAVSIIRSSTGTQFDPVVVEAFIKLEDRFAQLAKELGDDEQPALLTNQPIDGHRIPLADAG